MGVAWTIWVGFLCSELFRQLKMDQQVEETSGETSEFSELATVVVEDRDRFRQAKRFRYTDEQITAGTRYRYRVRAFTLDGEYSTPSNIVEVLWQQEGP